MLYFHRIDSQYLYLNCCLINPVIFNSCALNSNLEFEILTNGTIDFNKYRYINILIRENTVSSGKYTASFLEPAKHNYFVFLHIIYSICMLA